MAWRPKLNNKPFTVLSLDPGCVNFAYTVTIDHKVVKSGMLKNPMNSITEESIAAFRTEFLYIIDTYKPQVLIAERFLIRRFLTKLAEFVGIMIGIITEMCSLRKIKLKLITSATWKLSIKKLLDLKELYKLAKKQHKLQPHSVDSMLIGRYFLSNNNFRPSDKEWVARNLPKLNQA